MGRRVAQAISGGLSRDFNSDAYAAFRPYAVV
jgi:hypothetical protein